MDFVSSVWDLCTPLNISIYVAIHALTYIYALREARFAISVNKEADEKYPAFARTDKEHAFTWWRFPCNEYLIYCFRCMYILAQIPNNCMPCVFIRFFNKVTFSEIRINRVIMIGYKRGEKLGPIRRFLSRYSGIC